MNLYFEISLFDMIDWKCINICETILIFIKKHLYEFEFILKTFVQ